MHFKQNELCMKMIIIIGVIIQLDEEKANKKNFMLSGEYLSNGGSDICSCWRQIVKCLHYSKYNEEIKAVITLYP